MAHNANVRVPAPRTIPRTWATAATTYLQLTGSAFEPDPRRRGAQEWLMGVKFVPFGSETIDGAAFDWCLPRETTYTRVACEEVEFEPFIMELAMSAPTIYDGDDFQQYLIDQSLMQRSRLLASQVERAALAADPSLASEALIINNADQSAVGALLAVEDALADVLDGGIGMIHMTAGLLSALQVQGGFRLDENGIWRTATGHAIVADAGYLGVDPDTGTVTAGELWIYGSGPVFAKLDAPLTIVGGNPWERIDTTTNRYEFDVEQHGIVIFDTATVVAAKIDTSDSNYIEEGGAGGGGDASAANQVAQSVILSAIRDNGDTVETKLQDVINHLSTIMQFGGNVGILIEPVTADEAIGAATKLCGWSLKNASSSTLAEVTIHDGNSSAARVVASINLAGNETHTVVFPRPLILTGGNGLWVEVVSGDITDGSAVYYED